MLILPSPVLTERTPRVYIVHKRSDTGACFGCESIFSLHSAVNTEILNKFPIELSFVYEICAAMFEMQRDVSCRALPFRAVHFHSDEYLCAAY